MRSTTASISLALVAVALLAACGEKGSGAVASSVRDVAPFKAIDIDITGELSVTIGSPQRVEVSADDNLLPHITTTVDDKGTLHIRCEKAYFTNTVFKYSVTVPDLVALSAGRNAKTVITGLKADAFDLAVGWETHTTLTGTVERLNIGATGRSKIDASGLIAKQAAVAGEENALIKVHATETLTAATRQRAQVEYGGDPQVTLSQQAKGKIKRANKQPR